MHLIFLHGLDSSSQAIKAQITAQYAQFCHIDIDCPDLNLPPSQVITTIQALIRPDSVLIGSSLGGYFANLIGDMTGTPCILLNPSIRPDISFRRFLQNYQLDTPLSDDTVIYTTCGGWDIVYADLAWFETHRLTIKHPSKIGVFLQLGDELLDAHATQEFYQALDVKVLALAGGDHRISDYAHHVKTVVDWAVQLNQSS